MTDHTWICQFCDSRVPVELVCDCKEDVYRDLRAAKEKIKSLELAIQSLVLNQTSELNEAKTVISLLNRLEDNVRAHNNNFELLKPLIQDLVREKNKAEK